VINWAIEAGAPNGLLRRGFNTARATEVVVEGWQAKDGSYRANGSNIHFSGWEETVSGIVGNGRAI